MFILTHFYIRYQYLFFLLISLAPFFWNIGISFYPHLGGGDYSTPVDIVFELRKYIYTYEPNISAGYENTGYIALLFPYYLVIWILSLLKISPLLCVLTYIALLLFISQYSMFFFLRNILSKSVRKDAATVNFWSMIGASLYGFSPYPIGLIAPGHFHSLVLFAVFPLILAFYIHFLELKKVSFKILLILFFLFIGCTGGASYSVSILYVLFIIFLVFTCFMTLFQDMSIVKVMKRFGIVISLLVLANAWWLFAFLLNLGLSFMGYKGSPLNNLVTIATQEATIVNIFLGRAEGQLYQSSLYLNYFRWPVVVVFIMMLFTVWYALIYRRKHTYITIFFGMLLLGIFITKGPQPPLGELFQFLFDHVPGFQIFRRPINKFYWEFFFFFITLSMMGCALFEKHMSRYRFFIRVVGGSIFGGGVLWFVYSFIVASGLVPYRIPDYYYEARDGLVKENATRVLLLPGVFGGYPYFNGTIQNYYGVDFIHELWKVPVISPDPSVYSLDLPYKNSTNSLMHVLRSGQSICEHVKYLGISHIVVRTDLLENTVEDKPGLLKSILDQSGDIHSMQAYGKENAGVIIYSVKPECKANLLFTDNREGMQMIQYEFINPVTIGIRINNIKKPFTLSFLQNYSSWWKLYPMPLQSEMNELRVFGKKPINSVFHTMSFEYSNSWFIDPYYIRKLYDKSYYQEMPDGSISIEFILYYQLQTYLYIGIGITTLVGLTLLWIFIKKREHGNN